MTTSKSCHCLSLQTSTTHRFEKDLPHDSDAPREERKEHALVVSVATRRVERIDLKRRESVRGNAALAKLDGCRRRKRVHDRDHRDARRRGFEYPADRVRVG